MSSNGSTILLSLVSVSILHCYWREFWSRDKDVDLTYIRFGIILTQFYVKFSRQEHKMDVRLIGIVQLLRLPGFNQYPLSFFLYIPFKCLILKIPSIGAIARNL